MQLNSIAIAATTAVVETSNHITKFLFLTGEGRSGALLSLGAAKFLLARDGLIHSLRYPASSASLR